jgi:guanylate kinase
MNLENYKEQTRNTLEVALSQCKKRQERENLYLGAPNAEISLDKKTIVIVIGASGAGKDSILNEVYKFGLCIGVKTAVSRKPREGESQDAHVWMREQQPDETLDQYFENLVLEYDLIEHDAHHGNFYGLPRESIVTAIDSGKVPVIRTEKSAITAISREFVLEYNILIVGIFPGNANIMINSISERGNIVERIEDSIKYIELMPDICHYIIHNIEGELDKSVDTFNYIVNDIIGNEQ